MIESFHLGDLEPGAPEKYEETCKIVKGIQAKTQPSRPTEWVWLLAEILSWLEVRADYMTYSHEPFAPWPHAFIIQDIVKAFAYMAMFFPELDVCAPATEFFKSTEGSQHQDSLLLKPLERSRAVPSHRTRSSHKYRDSSFWKEWEAIFQATLAKGQWYTDKYPLEWSIAIRPIIAKRECPFLSEVLWNH